jgi:carboxymethylenebutenolidase
MTGRTVEIAAADGKFGAYLSAPASGKGPGVAVITHIYGVDPDTQAFCDRLAAAGCVAAAPNFFWRDQDSVVLGHGKEEGVRARARAERIDFAKAMDDLARAIAALKAHPNCNGKIAAFGFCFGGPYVWRSACGSAIDAGVSFHGTFMSKHLKPGDAPRCPVGCYYGDKDHLAPPAELDAVKKAVTASPDGEFVVYPGAGHGYMFPSSHEAFHAEAAAKSWAAAMKLVDALRTAPARAAE